MRGKKFLSGLLAAGMLFGGEIGSALPAISVVAAADEGDELVWGDFKYELNGDDAVTIIGYTGTGETLNVPAEIDGKAVTEIGEEAFADSTLKEIIIPEGVKSIGRSSFTRNSLLTKVVLPESLTSIESNAFNHCSALDDINVPDNVTNIGSYAFGETAIIENQTTPIKYIDNWLIIAEDDIETAEIKDGTIGIASGAFYNKQALTEINNPDSVAYIGDSAFYGCSNLAEINIPDNITTVGYSAFLGTAFINNQTTPIKYFDKWVVGTDEDITVAEIKEGTVEIVEGAFLD